MNDLCGLACDLRNAVHHAGRYGLVHFYAFRCQPSVLCGEGRNNGLYYFGHLARYTAQPVYYAFGNAGGHIYAYLPELSSLRRHSGYYLLHNGRYRAVQRGHVGYNAVVHGAHGLFCGDCARASHCSLHICGNAVHFAAEALTNACGHVAANVSENC